MLIPAARATVRDRFVAAWYAFRQDHKPDIKAFFAHREEQLRLAAEAQERRKVSIDKLEPYDRALVTSVAGGTDSAERLLGQVMPSIERLDFEDQLVVVKHIVWGNPAAARYTPMRNWITRNAREVLSNLPE